MLVRLQLTNFQRHENLEVEFSPGLTLIVGDNWTGKTTVLRGVLYCLFGSSVVDVKAGDLTMKGKKGFKAVLDFTMDGDAYTVTRSKLSSTLESGGKVIATSHTDVTKEIESLLGVSGRNFKLLNASQQGDVNSILYLNSGQINDIVNEITGVTLVNDSLQKCREEVNRTAWAESAASGIRARLEKDLEAFSIYRKQLETTQAWLDSTRAQYAEVEAHTKEKDDALAALEKEYLASRSINMRREKLKGHLESLEQQIGGLQQQIAAYDPAKFEGVQEKLSTARESLSRRDSLGRTLKEKTADLNAAASSVKKLQKDLSEKQALLDDLRERQVEVISKDLWDRRVKLNERCSAIENMLANAVCGSCGTQLKDLDTPALEKELTDHKEEASRLADSWIVLQDAVDSCQALPGSISAIQQQIESWEQREKTAQAAVNEAQSELNTLMSAEEAYAAIKENEELASAETLYAHLVSTLEAQRDELEHAQAELSELIPLGNEITDEQVLTAREACDEARKIADQWTAALHEQEKAEASLKQAVFDMERNIKRQEEQLDGADEQCVSYKAHKELEKFLKSNRETYMAEVWVRLLSYASKFISDATKGDITEIRRAGSGRFTYEEKGEQMPVELASGMQQAILGLGLKLALGAAIGAGRRLLILDEVTAAASDENSLMLCSLLAQYPGQVLMVSHRDADAAVADRTVSLT